MSSVSSTPILYQDTSLIAVDKPAGIAVIPGRGEPPESCLKAVVELELKEREGGATRLWVVHRLDRDVSGVLVFARNAAAHRELSMAFEHAQVAKSYWALVEGVVKDDEGLIDLPLRTGGHGGKTVVDPRLGKDSRTRYRVRQRFPAYTVLEAEPLTGRTHQIRVHLRALGHPLAVDRRYGKRAVLHASELSGRPPLPGEAPLVSRATLHAERLVLPRGEDKLVLTAPLPGELAAALAILAAG